MTLTTLLIIFLLGLCVGSFVNVLIYRTLNGMSPYKGRSLCDKCRRQLSWYENIPVVSYVVLGGKCRTCKKKIDWSYPVVEFVTGLLFLWWGTLGLAFFKLSSFPHLYVQPVFWLVVGIILVVIFFADLLHMIIPDVALGSLIILTVAYRLYLVHSGVMQLNDLWLALFSGVVVSIAFLCLFLVTKGRGLGFGDVKFVFMMGLLLGFPKIVVGIFMAFLLGGMMGILLLGLRLKKMGQKVPFGPFLIGGLLIALVWGNGIWSWYMQFLGW